MKTIAYEISEQLGEWVGGSNSSQGKGNTTTPLTNPDWYLQAVSGGLGPLGVLKGFSELKQMNLIERVPAFGIIQTEGCAPMVHAWNAGKDIADPIRSPRSHIATLSTGDPGRTYTLLKHRMPSGACIAVSDSEAFRAIHIVAKMEGISIEPAAGVAFAGLIKLVRNGQIKPSDRVVINCSGHTLPIESHILGKGWARNLVLSTQVMQDIPEEGLLAALNRVTADRFPKILIVDDHPDARRLIMRILQSQGNYSLLEAGDGREALDQAKSHLPDLIILDLMMPELDGFSVLDALKADQSTASIPVIVVTAKTLTKEERERLNGQIQKLMQKGDFLSDELLQEIESLEV
jgi:threonine synthase